jgi:general secretion pathway protein F
MAEYFYKATTLAGQTVEGAMEGKDEATVVHSLHQLGYIPIRISTGRESGNVSRLVFLSPRVGIKDLVAFTQEFSTLASAGLPIDRSLEILSDLAENQKLREVVRDVLKRIREGSSLADALSHHPRVFPRLYVNMMKAGEAGGFLETILVRLTRYLQSTKATRDYLVSTLIYPLILTFISGISMIILVTFVIPRFAKIFADMGQSIPLPTQIILTFSDLFVRYWWVGAGAIALVVLLWKMYIQKEEGRLRWDRSKLNWMVVGNVIKKIEVARFARTLGTLLQSGVSILSALTLVKEISQNLAVARSIEQIHDRLKEGKGISKTLQELDVFPPLAVHMIHVGEETGKLDEMLIKVAEAYEENVQTTLNRIVSLLGPLIIVFMGGVVGFIVVSLLLAVFSINEIPF